RNCEAARDIFRDAFLHAPQGEWLRQTLFNQTQVDQEDAQAGAEPARLSVLILCEDPSAERPQIIRSIESVKHFADEIVVFAAVGEEAWEQNVSGLSGNIGAHLAQANRPAPR